ncbi:hypothetical protein RRG08_020552 [Elysia crispata]|uniref:Uncharacterized protein n=1 Tax=Elysia crispata TaxID=231223 RepID=A0AAE1DTL3_9GAST|nr:hypothetical protein RRG08_020552 [Elysia crispata]
MMCSGFILNSDSETARRLDGASSWIPSPSPPSLIVVVIFIRDYWIDVHCWHFTGFCTEREYYKKIFISKDEAASLTRLGCCFQKLGLRPSKQCNTSHLDTPRAHILPSSPSILWRPPPPQLSSYLPDQSEFFPHRHGSAPISRIRASSSLTATAQLLSPGSERVLPSPPRLSSYLPDQSEFFPHRHGAKIPPCRANSYSRRHNPPDYGSTHTSLRSLHHLITVTTKEQRGLPLPGLRGAGPGERQAGGFTDCAYMHVTGDSSSSLHCLTSRAICDNSSSLRYLLMSHKSRRGTSDSMPGERLNGVGYYCETTAGTRKEFNPDINITEISSLQLTSTFDASPPSSLG